MRLSQKRGARLSRMMSLWAVDGSGQLRLLLREGAQIGEKTLKSFSLLSHVGGSPAQTRSFNNKGGIICRAHFTDGSISILTIQLGTPAIVPVALH